MKYQCLIVASIRRVGLGVTVVVMFVLLAGAVAPASYLEGVNAPQLAWQPSSEAELDAMAANGVRNVRISLIEPFDRSLAVLSAAQQRHMNIWLDVSLGSALYYVPGAPVRPGAGRTNNVRGLCHIDPQRFGATFGRWLSRIERTGVTLAGIEIGNEINWAAFNGDLEVDEPGHGRRLTASELVGQPCLADGFRNYVALLAAARHLLMQSQQYRSVPLVAAGLAYMPLDFATRSGLEYIDQAEMMRYLRELGADQYVDGYAIHFYPGTLNTGAARRALMIALAPCAGLGKACWVTEWGVASAPRNCSLSGPQQYMLVTLADMLDDARQQGTIRGSFWFDWCCDAHAIYRCGRVAPELGRALGLGATP